MVAAAAMSDRDDKLERLRRDRDIRLSDRADDMVVEHDGLVLSDESVECLVQELRKWPEFKGAAPERIDDLRWLLHPYFDSLLSDFTFNMVKSNAGEVVPTDDDNTRKLRELHHQVLNCCEGHDGSISIPALVGALVCAIEENAGSEDVPEDEIAAFDRVIAELTRRRHKWRKEPKP
jgi:hypothetical protein